jgi:hypothetical protein
MSIEKIIEINLEKFKNNKEFYKGFEDGYKNAEDLLDFDSIVELYSKKDKKDFYLVGKLFGVAKYISERGREDVKARTIEIGSIKISKSWLEKILDELARKI